MLKILTFFFIFMTLKTGNDPGMGTAHPLISNLVAPKLILWRPIQSFPKMFSFNLAIL